MVWAACRSESHTVKEAIAGLRGAYNLAGIMNIAHQNIRRAGRSLSTAQVDQLPTSCPNNMHVARREAMQTWCQPC